VIDNKAGAMSEAQIVGPSQPNSRGQNQGTGEMTPVRAQLENQLQSELTEGKVRMKEDERGLVISLAEAGFFDPGSAMVQPKALPTIDRIAAVVMSLPHNLRVEGHTDNRPIRTALFPSNWELSTARATQVLQYLISTSGIPPERLSAVGYGEYRPTADNETIEGRAANRRVDLVILGAAALKLEPK
jgi:chemotaxis protein MotB